MAESSRFQFSYGYTNPQDYFVHLANNSQRLGKDPFYYTTNLFENAIKLVIAHAKNKAWYTLML